MLQSEPTPLPSQRRIPCGLNYGAARALPTPTFKESADFFGTLESRRSVHPRRELNDADIGALLWHAARCQHSSQDRQGLLRQRRPYPSAGGLYETELLVIEDGFTRLSAYDAVRHAFLSIEPDFATFHLFKERLHELLRANATIFALVAHACVLDAAYASNKSLVWRDAGCVLSTLQLTATALGFASTCLGPLGIELAASLPSSCDHFIAVGMLAGGYD